MANFIGFAIADSMFSSGSSIRKASSSVGEIASLLSGERLTSCCNPSHQATLSALKARYGLTVPVPERAPLVSLKKGDRIFVISVRGLPRLEGRHEYSEEEIEKATFAFSKYEVTELFFAPKQEQINCLMPLRGLH